MEIKWIETRRSLNRAPLGSTRGACKSCELLSSSSIIAVLSVFTLLCISQPRCLEKKKPTLWGSTPNPLIRISGIGVWACVEENSRDSQVWLAVRSISSDEGKRLAEDKAQAYNLQTHPPTPFLDGICGIFSQEAPNCLNVIALVEGKTTSTWQWHGLWYPVGL